MKHFRYDLNGKNFLIRTDHLSLIWLKNFKEPVGIVARWLSLIDTYDFQIEHRIGLSHENRTDRDANAYALNVTNVHKEMSKSAQPMSIPLTCKVN